MRVFLVWRGCMPLGRPRPPTARSAEAPSRPAHEVRTTLHVCVIAFSELLHAWLRALGPPLALPRCVVLQLRCHVATWVRGTVLPKSLASSCAGTHALALLVPCCVCRMNVHPMRPSLDELSARRAVPLRLPLQDRDAIAAEAPQPSAPEHNQAPAWGTHITVVFALC